MDDINVHLDNYRSSQMETEEEDEYVFNMYDHQRSVTMVINEKNEGNAAQEKEEEEEDEAPCAFGGGGALSVTMADDNTPYESPFDNYHDAKNTHHHHTF